MKSVLLIGSLCGVLYQSRAIAKDQDGILIFGQGILGRAKNHVVTKTNNDMHVTSYKNTEINNNQFINRTTYVTKF